MKICDFHVHSEFSDDSDAPLIDIIKKAISLGLPKICITDHHDVDFVIHEPGGPDFQLDTDSYLSTLKELQSRYKKEIDIRIGVELGLMPHVADHAYDYVKKYPKFDFIIGSSHLINGLDPYYPSFFNDKTDSQAIREYLESILANVSVFDHYCVYGHLDYIIRYCPGGEKSFHFAEYKELLEAIFKIIIEQGKGIEINTGGLYHNMSYAHPHIDILKLYKEMGGEIITVGSDAHDPKYLCYGFDDTVRNLLLSLGYKYYCTYKDMKPEFHSL